MLHNIARVRGTVEALNEVDGEEDSSESHTICEGSVGRNREARFGPRRVPKAQAKACFDRVEMPAAQAVSLGANARTCDTLG
jgi:hypothetical protein